MDDSFWSPMPKFPPSSIHLVQTGEYCMRVVCEYFISGIPFHCDVDRGSSVRTSDAVWSCSCQRCCCSGSGCSKHTQTWRDYCFSWGLSGCLNKALFIETECLLWSNLWRERSTQKRKSEPALSIRFYHLVCLTLSSFSPFLALFCSLFLFLVSSILPEDVSIFDSWTGGRRYQSTDCCCRAAANALQRKGGKESGERGRSESWIQISRQTDFPLSPLPPPLSFLHNANLWAEEEKQHPASSPLSLVFLLLLHPRRLSIMYRAGRIAPVPFWSSLIQSLIAQSTSNNCLSLVRICRIWSQK